MLIGRIPLAATVQRFDSDCPLAQADPTRQQAGSTSFVHVSLQATLTYVLTYNLLWGNNRIIAATENI
jgi:hypothetical protein